MSTTLLALTDRGAGVPLRELALVGLTAAIITADRPTPPHPWTATRSPARTSATWTTAR